MSESDRDVEEEELETPAQEAQKRAEAKRELARDLVAFAGTVAAVMFFDWKAKDVIWGLWICSLTFGYTTIVVTIFAPAFRAEGGARVGLMLGGVFMLAFFTVHFGGFHVGHGIFLNAFFPLIEEGEGFPNPVSMIGASLSLYWPMVLATFLSRFSDLPLKADDSPVINGKDMMKPYANVIRMHLLIFVFAGLHGANLSDYAIYPVLLLYFFPWASLLRRKKSGA